MKQSALGYWLVIVPYGDCWQVASLSKSMRWNSSTINLKTKAEARAHRNKLLRHHKRLAARKPPVSVAIPERKLENQ